jgi:hypothetical protein
MDQNNDEIQDKEIIMEKLKREENPKLPNTITVLDAPLNGKVYLVGTAHFSVKSQEEVSEVKKTNI